VRRQAAEVQRLAKAEVRREAERRTQVETRHRAAEAQKQAEATERAQVQARQLAAQQEGEGGSRQCEMTNTELAESDRQIRELKMLVADQSSGRGRGRGGRGSGRLSKAQVYG